MEFKKKLKTRLYLAICYIIIGIIFTSFYYITSAENQYLFTLGIAFIVLGASRIIQYKKITKDKEAVHRQEIAETDERNIAIINKARGMAFTLYIFIAAIVVIVLEIMGIKNLSVVIALTVCSLVIIYWICYFIYKKIL